MKIELRISQNGFHRLSVRMPQNSPNDLWFFEQKYTHVRKLLNSCIRHLDPSWVTFSDMSYVQEKVMPDKEHIGIFSYTKDKFETIEINTEIFEITGDDRHLGIRDDIKFLPFDERIKSARNDIEMQLIGNGRLPNIL